MTGWSNWAGNVSCGPALVAEPRSREELAALLVRTAGRGGNVRVAGSGHSFTPIVATDDVLLSMAGFSGIQSTDREACRATVRAGTRIADLGAPLQAAGLALANQGDVDVQAMAGAISTGTHGTGPALGSLSTMVGGVTLATASGEIVDIDEGDPEALAASALSLGTLGVVVAVTLNLVPAYRLRERVWREPVEQALGRLPELIARTRHFEFFWLPESDEADCKALHPALPDAVPGDTERIDWSWRIFPSERTRKFVESEWSVPAERGPACFSAIRELMRTRHSEVKWPVEYRTVAADRLPLSPAFGRATVAISIHQGADRPWQAFFAEAQEIFVAHDGRPHWGKWHSLRRADFLGLYPNWLSFERVRQRFDPGGLFLSPYLSNIFE